jgi:hypothetical protein
MTKQLLGLLVAILVVSIATADAGVPRKLASKKVPSDIVAVPEMAPPRAIPAPAPVLNKAKGAPMEIGTSYYDYAFNSGGPTRIVWDEGADNVVRTYMSFIGMPTSATTSRESWYVSWDGTTLLAPSPVIPAATRTTYFNGIDVFHSGPADGFAGVAAGGTSGGGDSYFGLESNPGDGVFSAPAVSITGSRDTQPLFIDDATGTILIYTTGGRSTGAWVDRSDYSFRKSEDFGSTFSDFNDGILSQAGSTPGGQGQDALDVTILKAPNGNVIVGTTIAGSTATPELGGTSPVDSASQWGYFTSTDGGTTFSWTRISYHGEELVPGFFSIVNNFNQHDFAVDGNNNVHSVANGYSIIKEPDTSLTTMDVYYWNATVGVKSLVSFDRSNPFIDEVVLNHYPGNQLGCAYPSISVSEDGQAVFCIWAQPQFTTSTIDTGSNGLYYADLWWNISYDGGATWAGASALTTTSDINESFPFVADRLEALPGGGYRVRLMYVADGIPDQQPFSSYTQPEPWMYQEIDLAGTDVKPIATVPKEFGLTQNYPNPFNPSTKIQYSIPTGAQVTLKVYDLLGREVATLVNQDQAAGTYEASFDATNLANGAYLYKLTAGSYSDVKRMMLLK